ncbi:MAG: hypothetical protein P8176_08980 [Gammaproteobacteria bacterium]
MTDSNRKPVSGSSSGRVGAAPAGNDGSVRRREPDFDLSMKAVMDENTSSARAARAGKAAPHRVSRRREGKMGAVLAMLALLLVLGVGVAGYMEVTSLRAQLVRVQHALDTMSLLTEGQYEDIRLALDAAADQRGKWGKTVDDRLKFLDSEIRKLWVVAHQTNKPHIEKLEEQLKAVKTSAAKQNTSIGSLKKQISSLSKDEATLKQHTKSIEQLRSTIAKQDLRLSDVPVILETVRVKVDEMSASSKEAAALIEQLNQSRAQINRSIDQLTEEIRVLKGGGAQQSGL